MKTFKALTLIALLVVVSAFGVNAVQGVVYSGYEIGDEFEDFDFQTADGESISMKDFESANGFIIVFTSNTCPFSVMNEDRIIALDLKYKMKGYPVIAINPNDPKLKSGDNFKAMRERALEKGFTFPYVKDVDNELNLAYGATKTPVIYVLEKNEEQIPIVKYIGALDDNNRHPELVKKTYVENAIKELLLGKEVSVTQTEVVGCAIRS